MEEERIKIILKTIEKIQNSGQSIREYFATQSVSFSRVQYYAYCKTLKEHGKAGLSNKRKDGNYRKVTQSIQDYVRVKLQEKPSALCPFGKRA